MTLLAGLTYPLRALALINRTPRLWGFVIVPILVNLAVGAVLYLGLFATLLGQIRAGLGGADTELGGALVVLLGALLAVALAVVIGFLMVRFGVVLGAPWYGQLSEELEGMVTGRARSPGRMSLGSLSYEIWRALLFEMKKLALAVSLWISSLLLLLLPIAGAPLYAAVGLLVGALISCLDFFDGPQERRRLSFRQKLGTIRATLPGSLSFGLAAFALVSIPVVNLLAIPLCVVAGNLFVLEQAPARAGGPPAAPTPAGAEPPDLPAETGAPPAD